MSEDTQRLRRAALAITTLRRKLEQAEAKTKDETKACPIAILGMGCRFPGGVVDPGSYWDLLQAGTDAITDVPPRRWDVDRHFDADPEAPGKTYSRWGGFVGDIERFDAEFFGVSPREAASIDPQQRLLMETSWEALEHAGLVAGDLTGSQTGVYVGLCHSEYQWRAVRDPDRIDAYTYLGTMHSAMAGRISYALGLRGPNLPVDTACSSSLVAVHLACRALARGDCSLALAGGANLILEPEGHIYFSRLRALSPTGRCRSFSAEADGYVRAEGAGMIVLKRLPDALADGDRVLAVVRGSAVNQDGRSNGFTAPSGDAQVRVIEHALDDADLHAASVDVVECHGTGTPLGDPIEAQALAQAYGRRRDPSRPLLLGSVKSNIGHTEGAAGIAGLMKMVLALHHGQIPRTLHVQHANPHIPWAQLPLRLAKTATPWERGARPRRGGVSSFGFSGTNAHLVLEEAPKVEARPHDGPAPSRPLLLLSATSEAGLRAQAERLAEHLAHEPTHTLQDISYTLARHRTHFGHRASVVPEGGGHEPAQQALRAFSRGHATPLVRHGQVSGRGPKIAFMFTGQGSQYEGMGQELSREEPVFREAIERCASILGRSPLDGVSHQTQVAQPALFALEYALFALYRSWGVEPGAVIGHSIGELVAATVAGIFSLEDGLRLAAERGRRMGERPEGGAMVSLDVSEPQARALIAPHEDRLSLAAINGPTSVVISGSPEAIQSLPLGEIEHRFLHVSHAFHSRTMDPILAEFESLVASVSRQPPTLPMISNVTGRREDSAFVDPGYWARQIRQPVRFGAGLEALLEDGFDTFVELGPHPVLCAMGAQHGRLVAEAWIPTLRRRRSEPTSAREALGRLWLRGAAPSGKATPPGRMVDLPPYPFQRERHWLEPTRESRANLRAVGLSPTAHPLLGVAAPLSGGEHLLTGRLSILDHPWLSDHRIFEAALLPGTGFVELAWAAGELLDVPHLDELTLSAPLVLPDDGGVAIQLRVREADAEGGRSFSIFGRAEDAETTEPWIEHASGRLAPRAHAPSPPSPSGLGAWPPPDARAVPVPEVYAQLEARGYRYGPSFAGLTEVWRRDDQIWVKATLPTVLADQAGAYRLHPALLDAVLHSVAAQRADDDTVRLPFGWQGVSRWSGGTTQLHAHLRFESERRVSISLFDEALEAVGRIEALSTREATAADLRVTGRSRASDLYTVQWRPVPAARGTDQVPSIAIWGDGPLSTLGPWPTLAPAPAPREDLEPTEVPELVLIDATEADDDPASATLAALRDAQALLRDERLASSTLVWVTRGAVCAGPTDGLEDLGHAPLWGLLRGVRAEHPDRDLRLVDLDETADATALRLGLSIAGEPELAWRAGQLRAPRLLRAAAADGPPPEHLEGPVLITGGTGALGRLFAQHLARQGVEELLLTSRRGMQAPGAAALLDALAQHGTRATIVSCDVSDFDSLRSLFDAHEIRGIVHCAGALSDATLQHQDAEVFGRAFGAKAVGAWNLHRLSEGRDLHSFVLFSSLSGVLGSPGQSNYAAANAFLDGLSAHRRARGLPAQSLAWGLWQQARTGMTAHLSAADLARLERGGVRAITEPRGLELFEAAWGRPEALLVPAPLSLSVWTDPAEAPPLLAELLRERGPTRPRPHRDAATQARALRQQLLTLPVDARQRRLLALVREQIALVMALPGAEGFSATRPLQELGLDSLMAIELRRRLGERIGERLPPTLLFDHPSAAALAEHLLADVLALADPPPTEAPARPPPSPSAREPVAIVSMACRYPGDVDSPEALWELLHAGVDAIGPFPERWDTEALYDPDPRTPGKSYTKEGGFLRAVDAFDAEFFGISPREAERIDPQQRLLLEVCWEALERSGVAPRELPRGSTGVYVGIMYDDYAARMLPAPRSLDGYVGIGSAHSVAAGRVAYTLGLIGPAISVDTACSSSLVSLHLACQALRHGECDRALAGGVTVMATPSTFIEFSRQGGLAADGRCKSFSADADGVGWAEGCGMMVLKRLSDAQRDGDEILAVIRGSAVNQDGRSQGLTAPSGPSQQRVMRAALARAGLSPADVDYVEAHGTGTTLGDPIEARSLLTVYGAPRPVERPLYLGSLKSNVGHTQAAAGIGGAIKIVLSMQHDRLPKTLHADEPSPHVDWDRGGVALLREARPWPRAERPRRAAVSSFGISGTNAHVLLEDPPASPPPAPAPVPEPAASVLLLSARDAGALRAQSRRIAQRLREQPGLSLRDLCHTVANHRHHFERRLALPAVDRDDMIEALLEHADGKRPAGSTEAVAPQDPPRVVFVYPGQGSQWIGMGRELGQDSAPFRRAIEACDAAIAQEAGFSVLELLRSDASEDFERTEQIQPLLFAIAVGLTAAWRDLGITPDAVVGHSQGEVAAAHVAGILTLEDAVRVICRRSALLRHPDARGAMALVELPTSEVEARIDAASHVGSLCVAADNSERSTVISGSEASVEAFLARLPGDEIFGRRVNVGVASHSPAMDRLRAPLLEALAQIRPGPGEIPFISTVEAGLLPGTQLGADYWYRNLRQPVRFTETVRTILGEGPQVMIELSPHPVLGMAMEHTRDRDGAAAGVIGSLHRDRAGMGQLVANLGAAHCHGVAVDWTHRLPGRRVALPTYPFQRQRYWLQEPSHAAGPGFDHPLLSEYWHTADGARTILGGRLRLGAHPWLGQHRVLGRALLPAAVFVEFALAACRACFPEQRGGAGLRDLTITEPLRLDDRPMSVQIVVDHSDAEGSLPFAIFGRPTHDPEAEWISHASGTLSPPSSPRPHDDAPPTTPEGEPLELDDLYADLESAGLDYGPAFRGARRAWRRDRTIVTELALASCVEPEGYLLHPTLLDAALHPLRVALGDEEDSVWLPLAIGRVRLHRPGHATLVSRLRAELGADGSASASLTLWDASGSPVAELEGVVGRRVERGDLGTGARSDSLFEVRWRPVEPGTDPHGVWAVMGDRHAAARLASSGLALHPCRSLPELLGAPDGDTGLGGIVMCGPGSNDTPGDPVEPTVEALEHLNACLAEERWADVPLVWLTRRAVAAARSPQEAPPEPDHAPVVGLLRAARSERPDRTMALVDIDDDEASWAALPGALARACEQPELALRGGHLLAPRLTRPGPAPDLARGAALDGTVLVTGGLSGLGRELARHLVTEHGVRSLVLTSRRGPAAPGAQELLTELRALGASATAHACDVTDRDALGALLRSIPPAPPVRAVIHAAGIRDDATLPNQGRETIAFAMGAKAIGARNLHELTADLDLSHFVMFSSAAAVLGGPGQANYAAANAYLDALAHHRRALGLPGQSLGWGLWATGDMAAQLSTADRARLARRGIRPLRIHEGLALFDAALAHATAHLLPMRIHASALRQRLRRTPQGEPLWRELYPVTAASAVEDLRATLGARSPKQRRAYLLERAGEEVAAVLGLRTSARPAPDRPLRELGLDSLMALEIRNRLSDLLDMRLPATLLFDHPTLDALVDALDSLLFPAAQVPDEQALWAEASRRLDPVLLREAGLLEPLLALAGVASPTPPGATGAPDLQDPQDPHDPPDTDVGDLLAALDEELARGSPPS